MQTRSPRRPVDVPGDVDDFDLSDCQCPRCAFVGGEIQQLPQIAGSAFGSGGQGKMQCGHCAHLYRIRFDNDGTTDGISSSR